MKTLILALCLSLTFAMSIPVSAEVSNDQSTVQIEQPAKNKIFGFLKDINALNIALIAFGTFASGYWIRSRTKLKQLADIFQKAYEYTDDKRLSTEEREDLINRFFQIIGKK